MDEPLEARAANGSGLEASTLLAMLRKDGAANFDAVRLRYLEILAARAMTQHAGVKGVLEAKLNLGIADLRQRFDADLEKASIAAEANALPHPTPLAALVRELGSHMHVTVTQNHPRAELRAVADFRNTWAKLSADKHVTTALSQAPQNAGPINSHMLMLRSLALMRTISPDYLNRFLSYADALLCLEPDGVKKVTTSKKPSGAKATKK